MADLIILLVIFIFSAALTSWYLYQLYFNTNSASYRFAHRLTARFNLEEQRTSQYLLSLIMTNGIATLLCYLVLRTQKFLPLNPNGIDNMSSDLAFNTVISFITNTNLQHYAGESGLSYLSQMTVITFLMFLSAASGFCVALAFIRRLTGSTDRIGNFNDDLIKFITMVLLPGSLIISMLLMQQGVIQTLSANIKFKTLEGAVQTLALGPVASLESIKHLGTNGGGFFGANSSTPFENPTIISNMLEMWSMMLIPGAVLMLFGLVIYKKNLPSKKQVFYFTGLLLTLFIALWFLNVSVESHNFEGKETRFGITQSSLFATVTTSFTTGTVNHMHDSETALGGFVPLVLMMINAVFGGEGVGFMNFMTYVFLTLFIAGLMIGRTPQLFGRRLESYEMKLVSIALIIHPAIILGFSALALIFPGAKEAITNPGSHGISQILYEYTSSSANNGSGFEGLADNTIFWNITTGLAMFLGRYPAMILQLYTVSLLVQKTRRETKNEMTIDNPVFTVLLTVIILIFSALTFLPALVLGPIGEFLSQ